MMTRNAECDGRLSSPVALIRSRSRMVYLTFPVQAALKRIGVFPNIVGQSSHLPQFSCAK